MLVCLKLVSSTAQCRTTTYHQLHRTYPAVLLSRRATTYSGKSRCQLPTATLSLSSIHLSIHPATSSIIIPPHILACCCFCCCCHRRQHQACAVYRPAPHTTRVTLAGPATATQVQQQHRVVILAVAWDRAPFHCLGEQTVKDEAHAHL
jgi:hypothetical protein